MSAAAIPTIRVLTSDSSETLLYPLEEGRVGIGRGTDNEVVLQDNLVSRQHAQLEYDGTMVLLHDIGGKNPIRVNGEPISGPRQLANGDLIAIGKTELLFEYSDRSTTPLRVVRSPSGSFRPGYGTISLDAATAQLGMPDLDNAAATRKIYKRLSRLYVLSEQLLSVTDEEELYDLVLSTVTQATDAERGFVGLVPESQQSDPYALNVVRFWDRDQGKKAETLEMSESILQHIQRERKAVLVRDVADQRDFGMSVVNLKIRSFICVPIAHRDRLFGLLYVDTRGETEQLDRSDIEFVSTLGRMTGMSIENLRIYGRLQRENEQLRNLVGGGQEMIGSCDAVKSMFELIDKVAPRDASVLITGENGTGKELIARAIHARSARRDQPFVVVNCAAIPPHLVESELFGHEKGAFTGAIQATEGKFDLASGGTLFLDEIGDMPLDMQVKILRAVQERSFYRVGGKEEIVVDIRVVSATNRDLKQSIEDGSFREDLFFRLAVVTVVVPALRDRGDDVVEIAEHFLQAGPSSITLTKATLDCFRAYHWPGNVRELRNVLEQAVILGDGRKITPSDLPPHIRQKGQGKMVFMLKPLREVEKQYINRILEETEGNKAKAASILGISRETLYQKLRQYEKESTAR